MTNRQTNTGIVACFENCNKLLIVIWLCNLSSLHTFLFLLNCCLIISRRRVFHARHGGVGGRGILRLKLLSYLASSDDILQRELSSLIIPWRIRQTREIGQFFAAFISVRHDVSYVFRVCNILFCYSLLFSRLSLLSHILLTTLQKPSSCIGLLSATKTDPRIMSDVFDPLY